MRGLLIANKDRTARQALAGLFDREHYRIVETDTVANALEAIINREIQVVVLDGQYDERNVAKLVPLLKKCNRHIGIILVTDDMPLQLMRRIRQEGIFYHALRTDGDDHYAEIRQVVDCAFTKYEESSAIGYGAQKKERVMLSARSILSSLAVLLVCVSPAFAVDTTVTYSSGILVLLFVGFCALLIVAQLVPALLMLFGMTKAAAQGKRKLAAAKSR